MRKTMKRFLTAALSALAFVAIGFGVVALKAVDVAKAENVNLKIVGKTLNVSNNVNVVFFVPEEAGTKADITVHVTEKESTGDVESTLTADDTDYINEGKTYYRFVYRGVTAYEMENELIAYAELNGDVSPSVKYSILEYAYKKLGKADKEKDTTEGLEDLLKATLNYGSAAAKYKDKTLPADFSYEDDYTYVSVANATFEDGFSHGVFKKGDKLDVKPDEDYKLSINAGSSFVDNGDGTVTLTVPNGKLNDTGSFVHKDTEEEQEATEFATFELGANGSASHYDGSEKSTYTETVNGYTLSIIGGSKMYTGARDAKGNSCIKFGTDSAVGQCMFIVPEDVTEVVIYVAKYKAKTSKVSINGGAATTLTSASDNGEYDTIIVDTTTNKTVEVATTSGGNRAMMNTIVFKGLPVSAEDKVATVVSEVEAMEFENVTAVGTVNLPKEGTSYSDVAITWTMGDGDYTFATLENGVLTINELPAEDTDIILVATVTCDGVSSNPIERIVKVDVLSDADKLLMLEQESSALTFDSLTIDGNETIDLSNKLKGSLYPVIEIEWTAGTGATITDNVLQFANPDQTAAVTVTAKLTYDTQETTKDFSFTVNHVDEGQVDPEPEEPETPVEQTETITIAASAGVQSADKLTISWSNANFDIVGAKAESSTAIRTADNDHYRIYTKSTFTITAKNEQKISKIVITSTETKYASPFADSLMTEGATVTVSGTTVTVTANNLMEIMFAASAQMRVKMIEITYTA